MHRGSLYESVSAKIVVSAALEVEILIFIVFHCIMSQVYYVVHTNVSGFWLYNSHFIYLPVCSHLWCPEIQEF